MDRVGTSVSPPRPASANSPPPKCAICLGTSSNKCISDTCMHQFCFQCLMEWSKVKPECPLCKKTFKSIFHNFKSNDDYEVYDVPQPINIAGIDDEFLYLPPNPSRHFQFRTTFTVDQDGEFAIQQMLLSHPLTNGLYNFPNNYILPSYANRVERRRNRFTSFTGTNFRRQVYARNMWVNALPDVTGSYRDVSPAFFRSDPSARNRLLPWLNREISVLLNDNIAQVVHLVDLIMEYLIRWHIKSSCFKELLNYYLRDRTNHFIHEFYCYMRSPYDMIGYDRNTQYTARPTSSVYTISDHEDDSDVAIVNISRPVGADNNPFHSPTIEVIEIDSDSSHDSDVIFRESPVPEVVLVDSETTDVDAQNSAETNQNDSESTEINRKPILPPKIRLKHKLQAKEKNSANKKCSSKYSYSSSSDSSSDSNSSYSTTSSSSSSSYTHRHYKRKYKYKKVKRTHKDSKSYKEKVKSHTKHSKYIPKNSSNDWVRNTRKDKAEYSDSDDCIPLSKIKSNEKKKKYKTKLNAQISNSKSHTITSKAAIYSDEELPKTIPTNSNSNDELFQPSCSRWVPPEVSNPSYCDSPINLSSCMVSPINLSLSSNSGPNINVSNYTIDSTAQFKYDPYSCNNLQNPSLPQFDRMSYDTLQPHSQHNRCNHFNPVTKVNCCCDRPSYTFFQNSCKPLPAHTNVSIDNTPTSYNNFLYRTEIVHQQPQPIEVSSKINMDVGYFPIKKEQSCYLSEAGPSNGHRIQSVIVKKEDRPMTLCRDYLLDHGSESDE